MVSRSPSSARFIPGLLIAGKYRLVRSLGEGAMGVVWAAMNETTVREVALKLIVRPEPEFRSRLLREARACGALRHPNIVDVYDVVQTDAGDPVLVMELLTGQTVAQLLADKRRLDPPLAARIARDVAVALAAAHAEHIIHRDLKPANIFLHRPPKKTSLLVKVLDFGIAKNLSAAASYATVKGGAIGSPSYMSPEQVRGAADIDHRSDLWSLGVVLFEMLTGVRPFQGQNPTALLTEVLSGDIPKLSRFLRNADERLVALVDRCLRRNRDERFASAEEVATHLEVFVNANAREGRGADAGPENALQSSGDEPRVDEDRPTSPYHISTKMALALQGDMADGAPARGADTAEAAGWVNAAPLRGGAVAGAVAAGRSEGSAEGAGVPAAASAAAWPDGPAVQIAGGDRTARGTMKMSSDEAAAARETAAAAQRAAGTSTTTPLMGIPGEAAAGAEAGPVWTKKLIALLIAVIVASLFAGVGIAKQLLGLGGRPFEVAASSANPAVTSTAPPSVLMTAAPAAAPAAALEPSATPVATAFATNQPEPVPASTPEISQPAVQPPPIATTPAQPVPPAPVAQPSKPSSTPGSIRALESRTTPGPKSPSAGGNAPPPPPTKAPVPTPPPPPASPPSPPPTKPASPPRPF